MEVDGENRFGEWLFERISEDEISYRALGRKIGVHGSAIGHWIKGRSTPSPAHCLAVAAFYDVSPDFVLDLAGHRPMPTAELDLNDPYLQLWAAHADEFTPEDREFLRNALLMVVGNKQQEKKVGR